ncbi:glycosyltransferase family 92 protein [Rhizobium sp. ARZ01]|uniref:glycosyltransferase family 92 protein n=1 Tax=Rhizobium sp. ARZ01 TaxID=2769313 RepID=UPI001783E6BD|nr:glycosyltransferase family 92 protein [Rhizobium sp. ARZ01]MBD9375319.1 glycosyltransferase family 92 protein [Rhizobium sp. ARZ01]
MRWFGKHRSGIKTLSITPPKPEPARNGVAITACVKDEGRYIGEWARFHKAVGVGHFIIYDNGSTDDSCDVLREVLEPGELTIVPWAGRVLSTKTDQLIDGQVLAFAHAILNFGGRFRRMAFIDADEFLLPRTGTTIEEALVATGDFPNVSLPWHMFGTSGHKSRPVGPVVHNYTKRSAEPLSRQEHSTNFKCIVDPCEVVEVTIHQFKTRQFGDLTMNDAGYRTSRNGRKDPQFYSNAYLQLNHYYSKSAEEMAAKLARGSNYAASAERFAEKISIIVRNIEQSEVEDRAMIDFIADHGIKL